MLEDNKSIQGQFVNNMKNSSTVIFLDGINMFEEIFRFEQGFFPTDIE